MMRFFESIFGSRCRKKQDKRKNLIGMTGQVLEDIDRHFGTGKVQVGDSWWKAVSKEEDSIKMGTAVKVVGVNGYILFVSRA